MPRVLRICYKQTQIEAKYKLSYSIHFERVALQKLTFTLSKCGELAFLPKPLDSGGLYNH